MDIESLRTFLSVAQAGSFSVAAERLGVTQPAVSKRIAALERRLGTRLYDRIGHHIQVTEAGRALQPRARAILRAVDDAARAIADLPGQVQGPLHFATSHHIALHRLPPLLERFVQRYPDARLEPGFMDSEAACQAAESGEIELAVVTLPPTQRANLCCETIWRDPLAAVASTKHPLTSIDPADLRQLTGFKAILPANGTYTRQIADDAFTRLSLQLPTVLSINNLETVRMLVAVGAGWSLLPRSMLTTQVKELKVPGLHAERSLGVVYHRDRSLSNAARALLGMLREATTQQT